jgi:NAD(P)-dependent dehydrogenase (short-subunit alcohol dehydrogenase family)
MIRRNWILGGSVLAGILDLWRRDRPRVSLEDRVVIVTGASSGIGRAAAAAFAQRGAKVVLVARRLDLLHDLQRELAAERHTPLVVAADVSLDTDLQAIVESTLAEYGRIDVLVNNAGVCYGGPIGDLTDDQLRGLMAINLYGPMRLTQLVLPVMLQQPSGPDGIYGHIVNVSSMAGQIPLPGMTAYSATRRGLAGFTDALRRELVGSGVRVSNVFPTWTHTPMAANIEESNLRRMGALFPVEHFDPPEVPARAIVDAVRRHRPTVVMGGLQVRVARRLQQAIGPFLDLYWRMFVDVPGYIKAMRNIGTGE